jgi:hypothetical protein
MGSTERGIHTRDVDIFTISTEFIELAVLHEFRDDGVWWEMCLIPGS